MLHLTLCTLHSTLGTPHSTLHTLHIFHFTLDTSHSTIPTSYPTPHSALKSPLSLHPHSALHPIPHSTVFTGTVTGEECTKRLKELVAQKCFTWLHSGSLFARVSFLYLCLVAQMNACNAQPEAAVTESLED